MRGRCLSASAGPAPGLGGDRGTVLGSRRSGRHPAATPGRGMSRLAFHRPARFLPPGLPDEKIVLPTPPEAQPAPPGAGWIGTVLPLLSSVGMAAYMISFGRPVLIMVGVLFVAGVLRRDPRLPSPGRHAHPGGA